jgi:hypothetical protein
MGDETEEVVAYTTEEYQERRETERGVMLRDTVRLKPITTRGPKGLTAAVNMLNRGVPQTVDSCWFIGLTSIGLIVFHRYREGLALAPEEAIDRAKKGFHA